MLKEIGRRWGHHKINVRWMSKFFSYLVSKAWQPFQPSHLRAYFLASGQPTASRADRAPIARTTCPQDRFHTKRNNFDCMKTVGMKCFKEQVHTVMTDDVRAAVLELIQNERNGELAEHELMKLIIEVCLGVRGDGKHTCTLDRHMVGRPGRAGGWAWSTA